MAINRDAHNCCISNCLVAVGLQGELNLFLGLAAEVGGFFFMPTEVIGGTPQIGFGPLQCAKRPAQFRVALAASMPLATDGWGPRGNLGGGRGSEAQTQGTEGGRGTRMFTGGVNAPNATTAPANR